MAHGLPQSPYLTLYDSSGNAVQVYQQDGQYTIGTGDVAVRRLLEQILLELQTLNGREILNKERGVSR